MEWIVGTFVVLGLIAIAVRFAPRDGTGRVRLPRIVDRSIGMWALRRLTGRPLWPRDADTVASPAGEAGHATIRPVPMVQPADLPTAVDDRRVAGRLGTAPIPTTSSIVSRGPAGPAARRPFDTGEPAAAVRRTVRPRSASAAASTPPRSQPRITGWQFATLATVVAIVSVGVGALLAKASPRGGVLAAVGTPGIVASQEPAPASVGGPGPAGSAATSGSAGPSPARTQKPAAATPKPTRTPRPTPRPTPKATPKPSQSLPPAPVAAFAFSVAGTKVTFTDQSTGSGLVRSWDFGDGASSSEKDPVHPYGSGGSFLVKLTVTDSSGRTDVQSQRITVR